MRIALVSPYDLGVPGGVQSHVLQLAAALRRGGDQVVVLGPGTGSDEGAGAGADGRRQLAAAGRVYTTSGRSVRVPFNGSVAPVGLGPTSGWRVRRWLAAQRPDVVHVHEPLVPMVGLAAATSRVAPVVGTFHAWSASDRAYRAVRPIGRRILDHLAVAVAVSPAAAAYHAGALGVPQRWFVVVPNGVDTARFATGRPPRTDDAVGPGVVGADGADPSDTRVSRHDDADGAGVVGADGADPSDTRVSRHDGAAGVGDGTLDRDVETVLFVGRLEPRKGLATLVRAFVALRPDRPRLRVTVVGSGPELERCRQLVPDTWRDDVRFVGRVDDEELLRHMASADLYVSPALGGESFGIVLLEAMAAGRPVIASDIPGYRSVVTPGRDAELVPPGDPSVLAAAIGALLDDPSRRAAMVRAGHVTADAHDWAAVADRLRAVYARAIGHG